MYKYSITKYPRSKEKSQKEWTSISDIGKMHDGVILSIDEYCSVEDAYVNAILKIAEHMNIEYFKIKHVFRWKNLNRDICKNSLLRNLYTHSMIKIYEEVTDETIINKKTLSDLLRLELREDLGGLLYVPYRLKIFIGYDYMMGVHTSIPLHSLFADITRLGLCIFQFM